jgi:hypothetical protein
MANSERKNLSPITLPFSLQKLQKLSIKKEKAVMLRPLHVQSQSSLYVHPAFLHSILDRMGLIMLLVQGRGFLKCDSVTKR